MADRVQYLPVDLVSTLPYQFKDLGEDDLRKLTGLLADAHGRGYHDGYVRGMTEEHGWQRLKEKREKVSAVETPPVTSGVHPGVILRDELRDREITQAAFAEALGRPAQVISEIVNGRKSITADTALDFERELGIDAGFWVRAQAEHDLAIARQGRGVPAASTQEETKGGDTDG